MTVPNTNDRDTFTGDGVQTVFTFTFRVTAKDQVKLFLDDVEQAEGAYTVKLDASGIGGTVTKTPAPANGVDGLIMRSSDFLQTDDLGTNERLPAPTLERMVDKAMICIQQLSALLNAAIRLAPTLDPDDFDMELDNPQAGELVVVNEDGDGFTTATVAQMVAAALPELGGGDVAGPASASANAVAIYSGTTGKVIKDGPAPGALDNVLKSDGTNWISGPAPTDANFVVESGTVRLYFDEDHIPVTGWELCTGQEVTINGSPFTTPDCRGHLLLGAALSDVGSTGYTGADVVPGAVSGSGTHSHTLSGTINTENKTPGGTTAIEDTGGGTNVVTPSVQHNHAVNLSGGTVSTSSYSPFKVAILVAIKVDE